jgi:hypothetical protein
MHTPSPFNMQAGRVVLITGKFSDNLWENIVKPGYLKTLDGNSEPRRLMRTVIKFTGYDLRRGRYQAVYSENSRIRSGVRNYPLLRRSGRDQRYVRQNPLVGTSVAGNEYTH